jgi:probable F420-dependent oxidoreductase
VRIGLHALGIGSGAQPDVIRAVACGAEAAGFSRLWVGEHVVMVERPGSRYPYNDAGEIPVPVRADWLDPFVCLAFAAAVTSSIGLATGILLLPEHNPVVVAKQAASLDLLSGGRLTLGVGVGWSREEFDALGVPFARRGARTDEYIAAMRALWRDGPASFAGEFVSFESVHVNPKPVRDGWLPVVAGGNTDRALARAGAVTDGWYGFNLADLDEARRCVAIIRGSCEEAGRRFADLDLAAAMVDHGPEGLAELERVGVGELVVVDGPPGDAQAAGEWVRELGHKWVGSARAI